MNSIKLSDENVWDYKPLIGDSLCREMSRVYFRGLGLEDDYDEARFVAAMIYELKNVESENDTESEIRFISPDPELAEKLFDEYDFVVSDEEIRRTRCETEDEKIALLMEDVGFSVEKTESKQITIGSDKLSSLSGINKIRLPKHIVSLKDISVTQYRTMIKTCYFKGLGGALDDLPYMSMEHFESEISACSLADGKVDGMLLVRRLGEKLLQVVLFAAFGPEYKKNLPLMMICSARKALELYPPDTKIIIYRRNESVERLTDRLFSDCHGEEVYVGVREE